MICLRCQKETNNNKFCSRFCCGKHTYKFLPKRKKTKVCKCGTLILGSRKLCNICFKSKLYLSNNKISDIRCSAKYQKSAVIRNMARRIYKNSNKPKLCLNCGYDKHYEICHIKSIQSFNNETKLSVVNSINNLIALCPNCHWELDNNLLKLS